MAVAFQREGMSPATSALMEIFDAYSIIVVDQKSLEQRCCFGKFVLDTSERLPTLGQLAEKHGLRYPEWVLLAAIKRNYVKVVDDDLGDKEPTLAYLRQKLNGELMLKVPWKQQRDIILIPEIDFEKTIFNVAQLGTPEKIDQKLLGMNSHIEKLSSNPQGTLKPEKARKLVHDFKDAGVGERLCGHALDFLAYAGFVGASVSSEVERRYFYKLEKLGERHYRWPHNRKINWFSGLTLDTIFRYTELETLLHATCQSLKITKKYELLARSHRERTDELGERSREVLEAKEKLETIMSGISLNN